MLAHPPCCFAHLFKGGSPRAVAPAAQAKPPFLFGNFFFAALVTKKKWINGKRLLKESALFLDIKTL